jgi:5'-phosphate synthase pdxT subunit|tara:strand:- start:9476 stop:10054 length:579 start_codon:yes stop_codon:yes gene_type:complete
VGVLALQGASSEHERMLTSLSTKSVAVRTPDDLAGIDAIILPGGESTTISMLLESSRVFDPLKEMIGEGLPVLGTCAGMILLANEVSDGRADQKSFAAIDISVRRNSFGRQIASFESDLQVEGLENAFRAVFIRAPGVEKVGDSVEILATVDTDGQTGVPVLCKSGPILVSSFHPELTADSRIHQIFLSLIK